MTKTYSQNLTRLFFVITFLILTTSHLECYGRAFACATMPFDTSKFLQAIDDHVLSLREKNIPKAYYKYTTNEFQENTSLEEFTALVNRYAPLFDNQSIKLSAMQFYEEVAQYTGVITAASGESLTVEYQLTKSDREWKILGLKLMHYVCDQNSNQSRRGKSTVSS
ncbi:MAG: DUF4864 domain-containing protein [Chlamydiota bacterium]